MDRKNFFYRQVVTEAELDSGFDDVETGFKNLVVDHDLVGVLTGFAASGETLSPPQVNIAAGVAYSKTLGRRLNYAGGLIDLTIDEASNPITVPVASDNDIQVISLFLEPDYTESDLRTDGYGNPVYFQKTEAVNLNVVAGTLGNTSALPAPGIPSIRADQVLIADIVVYKLASVDYIVVLPPAEEIVLGSVTITSRIEYMLNKIPGDYPGDSASMAGNIPSAISAAGLQAKKHQTDFTLSSKSVLTVDDYADVNDPDSHDAFTPGGVFDNIPGHFRLKPAFDNSVNTYVPTADIEFSEGQNIIGGTANPADNILDLDTNAVSLKLTNGSYGIKNTTLSGTLDSYKIDSTSNVELKFENIVFDPINDPAITHDKLLWNVQNVTGASYRKAYNVTLKDIDTGSSNFIFGARVDAQGAHFTNAENIKSGNFTIDSSNGRYLNLELTGTDTTSSILHITGDNNIIENVVLSGNAGTVPMLLIEGSNNIVKNIYVYNFGTYSASISSTRPNWSVVTFGSSAVNNTIQTITINGGISVYSDAEMDLADAALWVPTSVSSIDDDVVDIANQPLADRINFSASASSYVTRTDTLGENHIAVEVWAKSDSGTQSFRLLTSSGTPLNSSNFSATTSWKRYKNIISSASSQLRIQNGVDGIARSVTFANIQRYALTYVGAVSLVNFNGTNNFVSNCTIENLYYTESPLVNFVSGENAIDSVMFDGLLDIRNSLIKSSTGSSPTGYATKVRTQNLHTASLDIPLIYAEAEASLHIQKIKIDTTADNTLDIKSSLFAVAASTGNGYFVTGKDCIFKSNGYVSNSAPIVITSGNANVILDSCYGYTTEGGSSFLSALYMVDSNYVYINNSRLFANKGRALTYLSCYGVLNNCILEGGTGSPNAGRTLMHVSVNTVSETGLSLNINNCLAVYNTSNIISTASGSSVVYIDASSVNMLVNNFTVKPYDATVSITANNTLAIYAATKYVQLSNILVDFMGTSPAGSSSAAYSPVRIRYNGRYINCNNLAVVNYNPGTVTSFSPLLNLSGVKATNITVDGNSTIGTGGVATLVKLENCLVANLDLLPRYPIPCVDNIITLDGSPSNINYKINYNTSVKIPFKGIFVIAGAAGSIINGESVIGVSAGSPYLTHSFIALNSSTNKDTIIANNKVKYNGAVTTYNRPMVYVEGLGSAKVVGNSFELNYSRSGSTDSITGTAPELSLIDAGANFSTYDVGQFITLTGASNEANNGRFLVTQYVSASEIKYLNPKGVAEAAGSTWSFTPEVVHCVKQGTGNILSSPGVPFVSERFGNTYTIGVSGSDGEITAIITPGTVDYTTLINLANNNYILIEGEADSRNNGLFPITARTTNTLTYSNRLTVTRGTPTAPAAKYTIIVGDSALDKGNANFFSTSGFYFEPSDVGSTLYISDGGMRGVYDITSYTSSNEIGYNALRLDTATALKSGTGTGAATTVLGNVVTLTVSGAGFEASDVGKYIKITNSSYLANDGVHFITGYVDANTIKYTNTTATPVAETFSAEHYEIYDPTVSWYVISNTSIIENNTFNNTNSSYSCSYSGLQAKEPLPLLGSSPKINKSRFSTSHTISGAAPNMTLTDNVAGHFSYNDIGKILVLSNFSIAENNGSFLITGYNSPTSINYINTLGSGQTDISSSHSIYSEGFVYESDTTKDGLNFKNSWITFAALSSLFVPIKIDVRKKLLSIHVLGQKHGTATTSTAYLNRLKNNSLVSTVVNDNAYLLSTATYFGAGTINLDLVDLNLTLDNNYNYVLEIIASTTVPEVYFAAYCLVEDPKTNKIL